MLDKGKYLTLRDHIALTMIVASIAITVVFQILTIQQKTRTSSPIPNTTMDSDGVIRLNPQNGCGPFAHVENDPKYGQLCIQNEGSWKVAEVGEAHRTPLCIGPNGSSVQPGGLLWSCQGGTIEVR